MNGINWMQQGWECPKCGAVMAPHVDCCVNCRGNKGDGVSTTITNPPEINTEWTGYPPINDPSSICSTSSPLDCLYILKKKDSHAEWWEQKYLNMHKESMTEKKEDPEE